MAIKLRPIASLTPHRRNARTHSRKQIQQLARSIKEFGFTNPVLIDAASGILAGHGRVEAAKLLGMTEVPTIELAALNDEQRRTYAVCTENPKPGSIGSEVRQGGRLTLCCRIAERAEKPVHPCAKTDAF
jgi:hypothetical protein